MRLLVVNQPVAVNNIPALECNAISISNASAIAPVDIAPTKNPTSPTVRNNAIACARSRSDTLSDINETGAVESMVDPRAHNPHVATTSFISVQYAKANMDEDKNVHPHTIPVTLPILSIAVAMVVEQHDAIRALEKSFAFIQQELLTMKKRDDKKTKAIVG